ncbi:hypothetical protein N8865_00760 [Francisellaceae bacterium]|nr:hypothetical protein [Francisellaceae bacterium]
MNNTNTYENLILATQADSLETAWMEGYAHGASETHQHLQSPYTTASQAHNHWQEGWDAGFYHEAARYPEFAIELENAPKVVALNGKAEGKFNILNKWVYGVGFAVSAAAVYALMAA